MRKSNKLFIRLLAMLTLIGMFFGFIGTEKTFAYEGSVEGEELVEEAAKGDLPEVTLSSPSAGVIQINNYPQLVEQAKTTYGNDVKISVVFLHGDNEIEITDPVLNQLYGQYKTEDRIQVGPFEGGEYTAKVAIGDSESVNLSIDLGAITVSSPTNPTETEAEIYTFPDSDTNYYFWCGVNNYFKWHNIENYSNLVETEITDDSFAKGTYYSTYDPELNDHNLIVYNTQVSDYICAYNIDLQFFTDAKTLSVNFWDSTFTINGYFFKKISEPSVCNEFKNLNLGFENSNTITSDGAFNQGSSSNSFVVAENLNFSNISTSGYFSFIVPDNTNVDNAQILFKAKKVYSYIIWLNFDVGEGTFIFVTESFDSFSDISINENQDDKTLASPIYFITEDTNEYLNPGAKLKINLSPMMNIYAKNITKFAIAKEVKLSAIGSGTIEIENSDYGFECIDFISTGMNINIDTNILSIYANNVSIDGGTITIVSYSGAISANTTIANVIESSITTTSGEAIFGSVSITNSEIGFSTPFRVFDNFTTASFIESSLTFDADLIFNAGTKIFFEACTINAHGSDGGSPIGCFVNYSTELCFKDMEFSLELYSFGTPSYFELENSDVEFSEITASSLADMSLSMTDSTLSMNASDSEMLYLNALYLKDLEIYTGTQDAKEVNALEMNNSILNIDGFDCGIYIAGESTLNVTGSEINISGGVIGIDSYNYDDESSKSIWDISVSDINIDIEEGDNTVAFCSSSINVYETSSLTITGKPTIGLKAVTLLFDVSTIDVTAVTGIEATTVQVDFTTLNVKVSQTGIDCYELKGTENCPSDILITSEGVAMNGITADSINFVSSTEGTLTIRNFDTGILARAIYLNIETLEVSIDEDLETLGYEAIDAGTIDLSSLHNGSFIDNYKYGLVDNAYTSEYCCISYSTLKIDTELEGIGFGTFTINSSDIEINSNTNGIDATEVSIYAYGENSIKITSLGSGLTTSSLNIYDGDLKITSVDDGIIFISPSGTSTISNSSLVIKSANGYGINGPTADIIFTGDDSLDELTDNTEIYCKKGIFVKSLMANSYGQITVKVNEGHGISAVEDISIRATNLVLETLNTTIDVDAGLNAENVYLCSCENVLISGFYFGIHHNNEFKCYDDDDIDSSYLYLDIDARGVGILGQEFYVDFDNSSADLNIKGALKSAVEETIDLKGAQYITFYGTVECDNFSAEWCYVNLYTSDIGLNVAGDISFTRGSEVAYAVSRNSTEAGELFARCSNFYFNESWLEVTYAKECINASNDIYFLSVPYVIFNSVEGTAFSAENIKFESVGEVTITGNPDKNGECAFSADEVIFSGLDSMSISNFESGVYYGSLCKFTDTYDSLIDVNSYGISYFGENSSLLMHNVDLTINVKNTNGYGIFAESFNFTCDNDYIENNHLEINSPSYGISLNKNQTINLYGTIEISSECPIESAWSIEIIGLNEGLSKLIANPYGNGDETIGEYGLLIYYLYVTDVDIIIDNFEYGISSDSFTFSGTKTLNVDASKYGIIGFIAQYGAGVIISDADNDILISGGLAAVYSYAFEIENSNNVSFYGETGIYSETDFYASNSNFGIYASKYGIIIDGDEIIIENGSSIMISNEDAMICGIEAKNVTLNDSSIFIQKETEADNIKFGIKAEEVIFTGSTYDYDLASEFSNVDTAIFADLVDIDQANINIEAKDYGINTSSGNINKVIIRNNSLVIIAGESVECIGIYTNTLSINNAGSLDVNNSSTGIIATYVEGYYGYLFSPGCHILIESNNVNFEGMCFNTSSDSFIISNGIVTFIDCYGDIATEKAAIACPSTAISNDLVVKFDGCSGDFNFYNIGIECDIINAKTVDFNTIHIKFITTTDALSNTAIKAENVTLNNSTWLQFTNDAIFDGDIIFDVIIDAKNLTIANSSFITIDNTAFNKAFKVENLEFNNAQFSSEIINEEGDFTTNDFVLFDVTNLYLKDGSLVEIKNSNVINKISNTFEISDSTMNVNDVTNLDSNFITAGDLIIKDKSEFHLSVPKGITAYNMEIIGESNFSLSNASNGIEVINLFKITSAYVSINGETADRFIKAYSIDAKDSTLMLNLSDEPANLVAIEFADTFTLDNTYLYIEPCYKGIIANGLGKGLFKTIGNGANIVIITESTDNSNVGIDVKELVNNGAYFNISAPTNINNGIGIKAERITVDGSNSYISIYETKVGIQTTYLTIKGTEDEKAQLDIYAYGNCFVFDTPTTLEDNTIIVNYAQISISSYESAAISSGKFILDKQSSLIVTSNETNEVDSITLLKDAVTSFVTESDVSLRAKFLVLSYVDENNTTFFSVNNTLVAHEIQLDWLGILANRIVADKVYSTEQDGKTGAFFAFKSSPEVTHDLYKVIYDEETNGYYIQNLDVEVNEGGSLQLSAIECYADTDTPITLENVVTLKSNIVYGFDLEDIYELADLHFFDSDGEELFGDFEFILTTDGKAGVNKFVIAFTHVPTVAGDPIYQDAYICEGEFEVLPKQVDIVWDADMFTFNGEEQEIKAHYVDNDGNNIPLAVTVNKEFKDAGSYIATAAFANDEVDYVLPAVTTKQYTMRKFVTEITWCEDNFTYNGLTQEVTATYYDVNGEDQPCVVVMDKAFKDAGNYTATALILDTNYEISGGNVHSYTIKKVAIDNITWCEDNYTFTGVRQVITASYKDINGDTIPLIVATDKEFLNAGTYTASAILLDTNYEFTVVDTKQYTIKPYAVASFWTANNYTYNGKEQVVEAWYIDIFGNKVLLKTSYSATFKDAGDYTVTATFKDADRSGNYVLNETSKNYKIEKKVIYAVDIEWCKDNYTYNGAVQTVTATFLDVFGNHSPLIVTIDREFKNAGAYIATARLIDTANYELVGEAKRIYTIAKAQYDMSSIIFEDKTVKDTDTIKDIKIDENLLPVGIDGIKVEVEYMGSVLPLPQDRTAGRYVIAARFTTTSENYEVPEGMYATLTVLWTHIELEIDGVKVVIIDSEDGIDPSISVVIQELDINSENAKALLSSADEFAYLTTSSIYTIKVLDENNNVTPIPSKVTVKVLIPEGIRDNEVLLHREVSGQLRNTKYEERDGYAVAEVTALGTLVISYNSVSLLWAIITLAVLAAFGLFGLILQIVKKRKANRRARANVSLFPILALLAQTYNTSQLSAVKVLGIVCVGLLIGNVVVACVKQKQPKAVETKPEVKEVKPEIAPEAPRTLSDSLAVAKASGATGIITKMDIVKHLQKKFGDKVEVNHRANSTAPGRGKTEGLPLADTHYALGDKRICFTYVYETNGSVLLLLRLNKETYDVIKEAKNGIVFSSFPKVSSGNLWYSLVVDSSFTKEQVFAIVDAAYYCNYVTDLDYLSELRAALALEASTAVNEEVDENKVRTLKESLAIAKANGVVGLVTKQDIIDHLVGKFNDKVEINHRANSTAPGRGKTEGLPLADTHYVLGDKRVCFVYVYETNGSCLLLLRLDKESYEAIKEAKHDITFSAFPRVSGGNLWYSVVIDASYVKEVVYALVDAAYYCNGGVYAGEGDAALALRDSLALAHKVSVAGVVSKQSIIDYLTSKYSEELIQINHRDNYTAPGRGKTEGLPLADTHYVLGEKKTCFVYVYEDKEAKVLLLIKSPKDYVEELKKVHKNIVKSKFPKAVSDDWYSAAIDDSYTSEDVYTILDHLIGVAAGNKVEVKEVVTEVKPVVEEVKEEKPYETFESIDALSADKLMSDEAAEEDVKAYTEEVDKTKGAIVNVDILGQYFNDGEDVTVEEIKKRVPNFNKNVTYIKVLARGTLSKKLNVYAYDFSPVAIKMILLAGGQVFSSKAKRNLDEE